MVCIMLLASASFFSSPCSAQTNTGLLQRDMPPIVGAEVFIEPGQSPAYIDSLFATLKKYGMSLTRIRLFESYMRNSNGDWDFSLFDQAYRAGEKYGVKIWGNFFPYTSYEDVGGFKFPRSQAHLDSVAYFIRECVLHFKQYKSHGGWALLNEIGSAKIPSTPLSQERLKAWLQTNSYKPKPQQYRGLGFDEQRFLLEHNTWYLEWLAGQVRLHDPGAHLHVNNHAIFQLVGEYDFPAWRNTLSSLGGSAHASWHFGYFPRNRYSFAVAANSAILQSGAGSLPWLMTELQGGNNTYSGFDAMCPTRQEITQWIWTVIGGGGKGSIFWSLNPRVGGFEAGEWAILDYQLQASDRLEAAGEAAAVISNHAPLFATAKPLAPVVHLLYTRPSLWVEEKLQMEGGKLAGRKQGGVMQSVLGYYETLIEMGMPTAISEWDEYDFSKSNYTGQMMILAHQIALPSDAATKLEQFVSKGGTLLVDGLTGYYDYNAIAQVQTGFPLQKILGGMVREFKIEGDKVPLILSDSKISLPGHAWRGYLLPVDGQIMSGNIGQVFAMEHLFGRGKTYWWPTLAGLGSRLHGNEMLAKALRRILKQQQLTAPVTLAGHYPGLQLQTLEVPKGYISVLINQSGSRKTVQLLLPPAVKPIVLFGSSSGVSGGAITLQSEETVVVYWE